MSETRGSKMFLQIELKFSFHSLSSVYFSSSPPRWLNSFFNSNYFQIAFSQSQIQISLVCSFSFSWNNLHHFDICVYTLADFAFMILGFWKCFHFIFFPLSEIMWNLHSFWKYFSDSTSSSDERRSNMKRFMPHNIRHLYYKS